jgi:hypothetical protein
MANLPPLLSEYSNLLSSLDRDPGNQSLDALRQELELLGNIATQWKKEHPRSKLGLRYTEMIAAGSTAAATYPCWRYANLGSIGQMGGPEFSFSLSDARVGVVVGPFPSKPPPPPASHAPSEQVYVGRFPNQPQTAIDPPPEPPSSIGPAPGGPSGPKKCPHCGQLIDA